MFYVGRRTRHTTCSSGSHIVMSTNKCGLTALAVCSGNVPIIKPVLIIQVSTSQQDERNETLSGEDIRNHQIHRRDLSVPEEDVQTLVKSSC